MVRARVERCAICRRLRRGVLRIEIFGATPIPRISDLPRTGDNVETAVIRGNRFRILRREPWCRPCALKVLDRMGDDPFVWRHATKGWPT